ncbi:ornithine--oxo-acid transaminase [Pedobacter sp. KBS0701]|uniref:ornithine--oxo-acid transaminase n=1 Tax=Pedobacter sp. KBS0701 TaxID=2578106 RepID=UPI00110D38AC|nr:ornithine--oxo-acid transaminase [Pedobacter sp. KBS0701]QDW23336.1 ornithine--oxo-acid transaminase [Pedobacter sp. KBS0701]
MSEISKAYIDRELLFGAHNYHPLPVVLEKGSGIKLWDVEGNSYFDFLSAYSAVNQGHCHPKIIDALIDQASRLTLTSRAFYNNKLGHLEEQLSTTFGFDKVLLMNSGAEAVETAIKLCRKWAYQKKKIPAGNAKIAFASNNFHGRTISIISGSSDRSAKDGFGPFLEGILQVPYNNIDALESLLKSDPYIAGFLVEPIQGEAGVIIPDDNYLANVSRICKNHGVLYIADEIQTGMGRTGRLMASYDVQTLENRPDMIILGKALSGGVLPVSAVLADDEIMLTIKAGEHGSTFGGNPLAAAVAEVALQVIIDENMPANAASMGVIFRDGLQDIAKRNSIIKKVRGKGLLNAIEIDCDEHSKMGWEICVKLMEGGLLAKPTHGNKIRLAPPLIISKEEVQTSLKIIAEALENFKS